MGQLLGHDVLVFSVGVSMEQADGDGFRAGLPDFRDNLADFGPADRLFDLARGEHPFPDSEPASGGDELE
ncbi:MAG: hypothetical protein Q8N53_18175, partial [Longimicrobiales bacterium]|nr:hypothetical protein [Longimicrobiales bacterium]